MKPNVVRAHLCTQDKLHRFPGYGPKERGRVGELLEDQREAGGRPGHQQSLPDYDCSEESN
jgi:hypothetical protein